jgi:hypothetical protein
MDEHDLLIRIDEQLKELKKDFENHLAHHFRYNLMAWSITIAALIGLYFK